MPKRSGTNKLVQMSADAIPKPTGQDLARLDAAMRIPTRAREAEESKGIGPIVAERRLANCRRGPSALCVGPYWHLSIITT